MALDRPGLCTRETASFVACLTFRCQRRSKSGSSKKHTADSGSGKLHDDYSNWKLRENPWFGIE